MSYHYARLRRPRHECIVFACVSSIVLGNDPYQRVGCADRCYCSENIEGCSSRVQCRTRHYFPTSNTNNICQAIGILHTCTLCLHIQASPSATIDWPSQVLFDSLMTSASSTLHFLEGRWSGSPASANQHHQVCPSVVFHQSVQASPACLFKTAKPRVAANA